MQGDQRYVFAELHQIFCIHILSRVIKEGQQVNFVMLAEMTNLVERTDFVALIGRKRDPVSQV